MMSYLVNTFGFIASLKLGMITKSSDWSANRDPIFAMEARHASIAPQKL